MALVLSYFAVQNVMAQDCDCNCKSNFRLLFAVNKFSQDENWNKVSDTTTFPFFEYEYANNENVELSIFIGQPLPFEVFSDDLQQEIEDFFLGNATDVPLLSYALDFTNEYVDEDEGVDIVEEEMDDYTSFDFSGISQWEIGNVSWLNFRCTSEEVFENYFSLYDDTNDLLEEDSFTTVQLSRNDYFICILQNRIIGVVFSAPLDTFVDYENVYLETLINISNLFEASVFPLPNYDFVYADEDDLFIEDDVIFVDEDDDLVVVDEDDDLYYEDDLFTYDDFSNDE